jgi:hypothetical protein
MLNYEYASQEHHMNISPKEGKTKDIYRYYEDLKVL